MIKKGLKYLLFLALFYPTFTSGQKIGRQLIDSLQHESVRLPNDTNKANILDKIAYTYSNINPDSGFMFANQALKLSTKLGWEKGQANAYGDLAICYNMQSNTVKALEYNNKALALYKKLRRQRSIAAIMVNTAVIYHSMSDYSKALHQYLGALAIFDSLNDNSSRAITLENIGTLYLEQKELNKTLEYYQQAKKLYEETSDIGGIARNTANLGIVYYKQGQLQKAMKYHEMALKLNKQIGNKYGVQINLSNIGLVYLQQKNFQKALDAQLKALDISRTLGNKKSIATTLGNIGGIYYQQAINKKQPDKASLIKAVSYLEDAIKICKEISFTAPITEFGSYLSDAYSLLGDDKNAYKNLKEFTVLKDSIFSIQKNFQLATLESKYLIEKQEKDLLMKDKQISIAAYQAQQNQYVSKIYVLGMIVMVLVLGIAGWAIVSYRARNRTLSVANKENETTIKEQLSSLRKSNATLKEIAHIQSHDVRGPVATILGLSQLFNKNDLTDPNNETIIIGIADAAQSLDEVIVKVVQLENKLQNGEHTQEKDT